MFCWASVYAELVYSDLTSFVEDHFSIDVKIFLHISKIAVGTKGNSGDNFLTVFCKRFR